MDYPSLRDVSSGVDPGVLEASYCATGCPSVCQGICTDADLAGPGVRVGFYLQALINGDWLGSMCDANSDVAVRSFAS